MEKGSSETREARTGLDAWNRGELPAPPDTRGFKLLAVVATVRSSLGGPATVRYGERVVRLESRVGGAYRINASLALVTAGREEGE